MIMIDNKPRYTAQIKLESAQLIVDELKDVGNRNLNDDEKSKTQAALQEALTKRTTELIEAVPEQS